MRGFKGNDLAGADFQRFNLRRREMVELLDISGGAKLGHGSGGIVPLRAA